MKHSCNSNKVVPAVIALGLFRIAVDLILAKRIYGKGSDDEWEETVNFANHEEGIHPIWDSKDTAGKPVLGLVSADYMVSLMNKNSEASEKED